MVALLLPSLTWMAMNDQASTVNVWTDPVRIPSEQSPLHLIAQRAGGSRSGGGGHVKRLGFVRTKDNDSERDKCSL